MKSGDLSYMEDMVEYAQAALEFASVEPWSEATRRRALEMALTRAVEIVGEAATKIGPATKANLRRYLGVTL